MPATAMQRRPNDIAAQASPVDLGWVEVREMMTADIPSRATFWDSHLLTRTWCVTGQGLRSPASKAPALIQLPQPADVAQWQETDEQTGSVIYNFKVERAGESLTPKISASIAGSKQPSDA